MIMNHRQSIIDLVKQYDGVSVSSERDKYIDLLGPNETPAMRQYFCDPATSGCALTIRGLWRKLGVSDKRVNPAYVFGKAVTWLVGIARDRGAWQSSNLSLLPQPGDFVLVGGDKIRDGGVEHVFTILSIDSDGTGAVITSIDGGQRDVNGQQAIFEKTRRWIVKGNSYWDVSAHGSDPGSNASGGRRVIGWGDIEKILEKM
jgi:hypothetical protein